MFCWWYKAKKCHNQEKLEMFPRNRNIGVAFTLWDVTKEHHNVCNWWLEHWNDLVAGLQVSFVIHCGYQDAERDLDEQADEKSKTRTSKTVWQHVIQLILWGCSVSTSGIHLTSLSAVDVGYFQRMKHLTFPHPAMRSRSVALWKSVSPCVD